MMTLLRILTVLLISTSVFATNEAGNKTVTTEGLSTKALERINMYKSSIKFWDTTNLETRKDILKQLAEDQDPLAKFPGCPRIRFPIICDNDGTLLENACYFRMRRRERAGLLPILVFTDTPIDQARAMCDKEFKKP